MNLTRSIGDTQGPHFYAEMGELISNSGHERFAADMLHLVDKWVPIHLVDLSEWTLDELRDRVLDIKLLGSAGLKKGVVCTPDTAPVERPPADARNAAHARPVVDPDESQGQQCAPVGQFAPVQSGIAPGEPTLCDFVLPAANPTWVFPG